MIRERTLSNGMELLVCPTAAPVVALHAWVDVGSVDEDPAEAGYCHFLEHMLFKGTKRRTTAAIAGAIEGNGGEMNAFTSFEHTVYHITISDQKWRIANEILADMLLGSEFFPKEFAPEKEVILEEIRRGEDSPDRKLYQTVYREMYGASGYGRPVIGFPKTVRACSASELKRFWRRWYSPSLMTLVVAGNVDPDEVAEEVERKWGWAERKAPRRRRREVGLPVRIAKPKSRAQMSPFSINTFRWVGSFEGCSLLQPELPALDVAAVVLGQGESSRLHDRLFRTDQTVTSVGMGVWSPMGRGMISVDVEAPKEKAARFREALRTEIARFQKDGPTSDELERAKASIEAERVYSTQTTDGLAQRVGFLKTAAGNPCFDLIYLEKIRTLGLGQVRESARRYLSWDALREQAIYPKEGFSAPALSRLGGGLAKKSARPAKPARDQNVPRKIVLGNGIQVVLLSRDDAPLVTVQAMALGGLRSERGASLGLGNVLSDVWDKGPVGWDAKRFNDYLELRGSRIEAFSGRNSLGLSATALASRFPDVLSLFIETMQNPALSEDDLVLARSVALEDIKTIEDESARLAGKNFNEVMFEGHPYSFPIAGTTDSVAMIDRAALLAHLERYFHEAPIVVAVVGSFDESHMLRELEKVHRARGNAKNRWFAPEPAPLLGPRLIEVKKAREQSHLIYGFRGTRIADSRRHAIKFLTTVLGGQSGRLFRELRDKQGLCYTVSPMCFEGLDTGYFGVYMGCDPLKREVALQGIRSELEKAASKGFSSSEIERAREYLCGRHHMDIQLNGAMATAIGFGELYGLGFEEAGRFDQDMRSVTSQAVKEVAEDLLSQHSVTSIVV